MTSKKIIVVGASSGIGREIVCEYVSQGALVGIVARRKHLLEEVAATFPGRVIISDFDVTSDLCTQNLSALTEKLGGLDLLIYCAGSGKSSRELDMENELLTVRINIHGFLSVVGFTFNYFRKQGFGQLAVISSVAALRGNAFAPAYAASKSFISNYAEALNIRAFKEGIDIIVSEIRPGFVATKPVKDHKRFWVCPVNKAAKQAIRAIEKKKRVAYISKRWIIIGFIMRFIPYALYRRMV